MTQSCRVSLFRVREQLPQPLFHFPLQAFVFLRLAPQFCATLHAHGLAGRTDILERDLFLWPDELSAGSQLGLTDFLPLPVQVVAIGFQEYHALGDKGTALLHDLPFLLLVLKLEADLLI